MNRDELLDKLAMELGEWTETAAHALDVLPKGFYLSRHYVFYPTGMGGFFFSMKDWLQRRTELINKPSWQDAPEWAEWLAQDSDGRWTWFEAEIEAVEEDDEWLEKEGHDGRIDFAVLGKAPNGHDWRETLEQRAVAETKHNCPRCGGSYWEPYHDRCPCDEPATHSKYHREVRPGVWIDVYDVLQAWSVKNPALQHLIKKALAPGERGHKTLNQDMDDIVVSAKRAKELAQD